MFSFVLLWDLFLSNQMDLIFPVALVTLNGWLKAICWEHQFKHLKCDNNILPLASWIEQNCLLHVISSRYRIESLGIKWSSQTAKADSSPASLPGYLLFCLVTNLVRSAILSQCANIFNSSVKFCVTFCLNSILSRLVHILLNCNILITKNLKRSKVHLGYWCYSVVLSQKEEELYSCWV